MELSPATRTLGTAWNWRALVTLAAVPRRPSGLRKSARRWHDLPRESQRRSR
jgi:hypothetical protein